MDADEDRSAAARRDRALAWSGAAAFALAAFSLRQERLVGEAFAGGYEHSPFWSMWHRLGWITGRWIGWHGERVRFALSALAYGACFPAGLALARAQGLPLAAAAGVSAAILLAPTAWLAGTTPGTTAVSLLLLVSLLRSLVAGGTASAARTWTLWALAVGVQLSNLTLWPAVALACAAAAPREPRRAARSAILVGVGVLSAATAMHLSKWDPIPLPVDLAYTATRFQLDPQAWVRVSAVPLGLGFGSLGLLAFGRAARAMRRGQPASRAWLALWCGLPFSFLLLNSELTWDASYHWLLPAALLGGVRALDAVRSPRVLAAPFAQLALLVPFQRYVTETDPLTEWRVRAEAFFQPRDTVITGEVLHAYLSSHRWGLKSVVLYARDPDEPSIDFIDGIYTHEAGQTNLLPKTQDVEAWADEGIEARAFGFRLILDRPFPEPSEVISEVLERELWERVEINPFDSR